MITKWHILMIFLFFQTAQYRPPLLYCEEWKEVDSNQPLSQDDVQNPDLILNLYGNGKNQLKKSHHDKPADDPFYVWSGLCEQNWAVTLKYEDKYADLSRYGRVRWRTKQSGFHALRLLLKTSGGQWLISDIADGASGDWHVFEFIISDIEWYSFDPENISEGEVIDDPPLDRIEEIGFTDLRKGGKSSACSRIDWIEVYAF